jgi:hypothetical protein
LQSHKEAFPIWGQKLKKGIGRKGVPGMTAKYTNFLDAIDDFSARAQRLQVLEKFRVSHPRP